MMDAQAVWLPADRKTFVEEGVVPGQKQKDFRWGNI
jgi:hypothetical protein